jgi:beta-N-acetylhexosaminidase
MVLLCNQSVGDGAAINELIGGLEVAMRTGVWKQNPASEARRSALLPHMPAQDWDTLIASERYQQALKRVPR